MIKEEYVSFEVAKLLRDKGFDEPTIGTYNIESKNSILVERPIRAIHCEAIISAPTQAMAMMWLREVHKLYIEITPSSKTNEFIVDSYRIDIVTKTFDTIYVSSGYDTYEQACEAAIKYCLENLI